ncbi:MAG: hypothetical protein KKA28_00560 [Planctomycetes bacterium]|nr:hypothetical protein [Planctomycetota bacterium]MCG2684970.1 hypothetical protein [Planctomycetales bacterium]
MLDKKHLRKHLFVDPKLQGPLIARVVFYWIVCLISITLMLLCWQVLSGPPRPFHVHLNKIWFQYGPALVASLIMLPLVIIDIVRFSNRFVGPLLRLRRSMRELARGEQVEPIEFRETDFWQELADEFNAVMHRVQNHPADDENYSHQPEEDEPVAVG